MNGFEATGQTIRAMEKLAMDYMVVGGLSSIAYGVARTTKDADIVVAVEALMQRFDDDYWLERDRTATFHDALYTAMAEGGWLGIAMPEGVGGSGLGVSEAALMMMAVAYSGRAVSAASAVHMNIFGPHPIVVFGSEEQKHEWLPPLIRGEQKCCFGVTEPDAGLDTGSITTFAERINGGFRINREGGRFSARPSSIVRGVFGWRAERIGCFGKDGVAEPACINVVLCDGVADGVDPDFTHIEHPDSAGCRGIA